MKAATFTVPLFIYNYVPRFHSNFKECSIWYDNLILINNNHNKKLVILTHYSFRCVTNLKLDLKSFFISQHKDYVAMKFDI